MEAQTTGGPSCWSIQVRHGVVVWWWCFFWLPHLGFLATRVARATCIGTTIQLFVHTRFAGDLIFVSNQAAIVGSVSDPSISNTATRFWGILVLLCRGLVLCRE